MRSEAGECRLPRIESDFVVRLIEADLMVLLEGVLHIVSAVN